MKKKDITPDIINEVMEITKNNPNISIEKIIKIVNEKLGVSLTRYNVKQILEEMIDDSHKKIEKYKEELEEINKDINEKKLYEVSDDHYIFYIQVENEYGEKVLKPYPISIELVDSIFKDYSKYGNNLTSEQILQKYNLKPELWYALKRRLRLYKDSNILSPITLQRMSEKEAHKKIEDVIDETIQSKYKKSFVEVYERKKERQYKKMSQMLSSWEAFLEGLEKYLQSYEPKKFDFTPEKIDNDDEIIVMFSDLHIGKMNTKQVLERIRKMGMDLVKRKERKVNLVCLGDLFENITTEGMHPGQLQSMDYTDPYQIIMDTVEILEQLIIKLLQQGKEVLFSGIGGNHSRITANPEGDQERIASLLTYELIKRGLKDTDTKFNILREGWNKMGIMGYNVILHHGDKGAVKKKPSQILWELGERDKHNLIVFGHMHKYVSEDVANNATVVIVPAMAGANVYDQSLLLSSYTGYVIIKKDEDGTPIQIVRRFNF